MVITQAKRKLCNDSLYYFVRLFWSLVVPEKFVPSKHVEYICATLQDVGRKIINREPSDGDLIINISPGFSKSTVCSIMFPAWLWAMDPKIRIITASYAMNLSLEFATKSRRIIEDSLYKELFPDVKLLSDQNAKGNYQTKSGGARITTSPGGTITGMHAQLIIMDDIQNAADVFSEKERITVNEFISSTLASRLLPEPYCLKISIQQRLHPLDTTAFLLSKNTKTRHICLPAQVCSTVKPAEALELYTDGLLDPNRFTIERLMQRQEETGTSAYLAQYLQNPGSDKDAIIKENWIKIITAEDFARVCKGKEIRYDFFIDTAYTEDRKNDPSAICACTKVGEILYITGSWQGWKEFPEFLKDLESYVTANGYTNQSRIRIEPKASGKSVVQVLKQTKLNVSETAAPSKGKLERLNAIAPKVEAGKVMIVQGVWNSALLAEVCSNYPPHDDRRDTFIMAIEDKLIENPNAGSYKNRLGFV